MIYYVDSSVLVKRYVDVPGSSDLRTLMERWRQLATSALTLVEIRSALARMVREERFTRDEVAVILARVDRTVPSMEIVEPRGQTLAVAGELVSRHPLRAYDAVQLASALRVATTTQRPVTFACSDAPLRTAAAAEGLRTLPA